MVTLTTGRLILRPFDADDVDALVELNADPEVMFFITGGRATPRAEIEEDVLPAYLRYRDGSSGYGYWAAQDRATGAFLGWFHLRPTTEHGPESPELGYRLRRSAWGRGLATEGSRAVIDLAFTQLGARRVLAEAMAVHAGSRRVMEKCGMTVVRVFHGDWPDPIPGDEHGDVQYQLTRESWASEDNPKV